MPAISMGPMSMKLNFNDIINGEQLAIPGKFSTPILNGAIFHQSTFNDLFGWKDSLSLPVSVWIMKA